MWIMANKISFEVIDYMKCLLLIFTLMFCDAYAMQQSAVNIQTEKENVAIDIFHMSLLAIESNSKDEFIKDVLEWAAEQNYVGTIRHVLHAVKHSPAFISLLSFVQSSSLKIPTALMQPAFIKAASLGRIGSMNLFLQEGVSIDPGIALVGWKEYANALMEASKNGHVAAVQL